MENPFVPRRQRSIQVYDLIWRSQSRFPQKYFGVQLLEHFKFIVHLSFITSLDMSGHFVWSQKKKQVDGGWLEIMKSGGNWSYFPSLKNCLKQGYVGNISPKKSHKTNVAPARRPGPKRKLIFHPQCFSYVCVRENFFLFLNAEIFWNSASWRFGVFSVVSTVSRKKTSRNRPQRILPQKFPEFCAEYPLLGTNIAPENGWLEYYSSFLLGLPIFSCYVRFRECNSWIFSKVSNFQTDKTSTIRVDGSVGSFKNEKNKSTCSFPSINLLSPLLQKLQHSICINPRSLT